MIYKNTFKTKRMTTQKLTMGSFKNGINSEFDEHLLPINYSKNTYNLDFVDGALRQGLGVAEPAIPYNKSYINDTKSFIYPPGVNILGAWQYNRYEGDRDQHFTILVIYCSNKKLYYNLLSNPSPHFFEIDDIELSQTPNAVNYRLNGREVMVFTTPTDGMWVWGIDTHAFKVEDAPNITSMCVHYERLFVTVENPAREIWFSDDLDITNWSVSLNEAGYIQLADDRGTLNKVISLNDHVYIFREFGISRLTAYADQRQFNVSQIYISSSRIYENTVTACGDKVFFMTKDGVFVFNGLSVQKLHLTINSLMVPNHKAVGSYHNGKYYLSLKINFNDSKKIGYEVNDTYDVINNNTLLEIDVNTQEIKIMRGVCIDAMTPVNHALFSTMLLIVRANRTTTVMQELANNGMALSGPLPKMWQSPTSDLGTLSNYKVVKEISFKNKHDVVVEIEADGVVKQFSVAATKATSTIKPNLKGKLITISFSSNQQNFHISSPEIIYGVI